MAAILPYQQDCYFKYERSWPNNKAEEKVTLTKGNRKEKCPVYDRGAEHAILHVYPEFMKQAGHLNFTVNEHFDKFGDVLHGAPATCWAKILQDDYSTPDTCTQAISRRP